MKGSMKNLAVLVVIATIAMFISTAMAKDRKAIRGEYAGTSMVSCNAYLPNGTVNACTANQLSIYTFNGDGTGAVQGRFVMITFSPTPSEMFLDISWDFTYEVADDGTITMDVVPGTGLWKLPDTDIVVYKYTGGTFSGSGRFSVDHKTIIFGTVMPTQTVFTFTNGPSFTTKCNTSRVLIRVRE